MILDFTFEPAMVRAFIECGHELRSGDRRWIPPIRKSAARTLSPEFCFHRQPGCVHRHFLCLSGGRRAGRVTAMVNPGLRDPQGRPVGLVGNYECVDDQAAAADLLAAAVSWLREEHGLPRVWGPVNYDIWHGFRFMVRGFDRPPFLGEPDNPPHYPEQFARFGFRPLWRWDTLEVTGRKNLESMIQKGLARRTILEGKGYRFPPLDRRRFDAELVRVHSIVCASFARHPGFTPIDLAEFLEQFRLLRAAFVPRLSTFALNEKGELVGFAAAFPDLSDAVRAMKGRSGPLARLRFLRGRRLARTINFYIGGVTPEEEARGSGLGRAGFAILVSNMLRMGYDRLLLTLRLAGSPSRSLPGRTAPIPQREYALFGYER